MDGQLPEREREDLNCIKTSTRSTAWDEKVNICFNFLIIQRKEEINVRGQDPQSGIKKFWETDMDLVFSPLCLLTYWDWFSVTCLCRASYSRLAQSCLLHGPFGILSPNCYSIILHFSCCRYMPHNAAKNVVWSPPLPLCIPGMPSLPIIRILWVLLIFLFHILIYMSWLLFQPKPVYLFMACSASCSPGF